jgi:hypothetical protein
MTHSALEESELEDNDNDNDEFEDASDSPQGYNPSTESTPNNAYASSTAGSRSGSGRASSSSARPGRKLSRPTGKLQLVLNTTVTISLDAIAEQLKLLCNFRAVTSRTDLLCHVTTKHKQHIALIAAYMMASRTSTLTAHAV